MKFRNLIKYALPGNLLKSRTGYCPICNSYSVFIMTGAPDRVREHAVCIWCRSVSRYRHFAKCILETFQARGITTLSDFQTRPDIKVFNTTVEGPVFKAMGNGSHIIASEYYDGIESGAYKNGVLCQNLEKLSFADGEFDLILSEDVFEHLTDFKTGFREVHRVLKNGGYHIFTIPFYFDRRTRDLFELIDGKIRLFEPIEYHGDPIRGQIPCFTHFGYDLLDWLREIGFETRIEVSQFRDDTRYGTFNSYTLITKKL